MSLRLKICCLFVALTLACLAGVNWFVNARVERGFRAVEAQLSEQQITRIREAVTAEQRTLAQLVRIDAVWSEPYRLLESGDAAAIARVYPPSDLLHNYRISEMVVVDAQGALFAGGRTSEAEGFDGATSQAVTQPEAFVGAADRATCGLWQLDAVSLYCTHPVLHTDGSGPPVGWLTFFQPVDEQLLSRLSQQLQLPLHVQGAEHAGLTELDADTLQLTTVFDVDGSDVPLRLSADVARPVTVQARQTQRDLIVALLACVGLFASATAVLAELLVLRRVVRVTRLATDVRRTGDLGLRAQAHGSDELAALTGSVNDMLTALEHQRAELTEASTRRDRAETSLDNARRAVIESSQGVLDQLAVVADGAQALRRGADIVGVSAATASSLIGQAHTAVQDTEALVDELVASMGAIQQVATFIASVAQQTNLLALNATIEAARAGPAGRGFAVVAGEVKELALKTSESTLSIERDVTSMRAGVRAIEDSIAGIATLTGRIDTAAGEIVRATAEQTEVTDRVALVLDHSRSIIVDIGHPS